MQKGTEKSAPIRAGTEFKLMLALADGLTVLTDLEALAPPLPMLIAYWERKRGTRIMPAPSDIDPVEMPRLLPYIAIADITCEPLDMRYRLMGTRLVEMGGVDRTGTSIREAHSGERLAERLAALEHLLASPGPVAHGGHLDWLDRGYRRFECVHLPLSADGVNVTRLIAAYAFP
ncbi:PAS domain-containing protein [uncultured Parvibaculum sp.]|uniref:PAS domain-containing protein n=1 Tax=uncultured Parvibaculum sp. TaxID=291828 RepID=UPI0030D9FDCA|tara:strand:- start:93005 stop:93529 length:525 start_codon:yes stop_codon:yes gene_type:complete